MIVTCPRCLTKFNLPDESMESGVEVDLRCSRCAEEFRFSPQDDSSIAEDVIDPLAAAVESSGITTDSAEIDQSELPVADAADPSPDIEFDEGFETIDENNTAATDPIETVVGDGLDVDELFALSDAETAVDNEVSGDGSAAEDVDEDTIFELSDDFDNDEADFNVAGEPAVEDIADADDSAIEELALDVDDIDLGDIEFDNFDDDSAAATELAADTSAGENAKPTQLDADDDFAGLLDPGADAEVVVAEPAELPKGDKKSEPDKKPKPESTVKPASVGSQKRTLIMVLSCFLVLSLALWAGYGLWQRFSVNMTKHLQLLEVSNQRLRLPSERVVIVLRGKVVNNSPKLVTDLKIKGVLVDEKGKILAEVITSGGVSFSEEELDLLDSKKLAMLENSAVNLPQNGGELPFMIAFYDYPDGASDCYVELSSFKVKKGRLR